MMRAISLLKSAWSDLVGVPPAMPNASRDQLSIIQFDRLRQRIPILYLVVAMISVGAGLSSQGDFPVLLKFAPPGILLVASILRYVTWVRRRNLVVDAVLARRYLHRVIMLSIALMGLGSFWAVMGFFETIESSRAFAVVFMFLGAFACANCLASLPSASVLALVIGLGPISLAMLFSDDLRMVSLGASAIAVSLLHIRLVTSQFGEMVRNLMLQAELEVQASTDSLTNLLNRRAFGRILDDRIANCEPGEGFVVALLDLDGFKPINDRLGHAAGDSLLVMLSARLCAICGPAETIARIGGDEFAIIIGDPKGRAAVERRIASMTKALAEPYRFDDQFVHVAASFGTARFPDAANTAAGLLDAADAALYCAKADKKAPSRRATDRISRPASKKAA